jgi:PhnB protein
MQLKPYLNFNGQCEAALKFYEQCLGGKIEMMMTHAESPMADQVGAEWKNKILHARIRVGDDILMASDCPPEYYEQPQGFAISLDFEKVEEAERVFAALSENGTIKMPLQQTFWAARFGMLIDQFGTPWMISCE